MWYFAASFIAFSKHGKSKSIDYFGGRKGATLEPVSSRVFVSIKSPDRVTAESNMCDGQRYLVHVMTKHPSDTSSRHRRRPCGPLGKICSQAEFLVIGSSRRRFRACESALPSTVTRSESLVQAAIPLHADCRWRAYRSIFLTPLNAKYAGTSPPSPAPSFSAPHSPTNELPLPPSSICTGNIRPLDKHGGSQGHARRRGAGKQQAQVRQAG